MYNNTVFAKKRKKKGAIRRMYGEQPIDTSDIDRKVSERRNYIIQQLHKEIVNQVDTMMNTGQIKNRQQGNGMVVSYVSFNVCDMPSFRLVFPFGKGAAVCNAQSPTFKRQSEEAVNRLKQLCATDKIEIGKDESGTQMIAQRYI